MKCGDVVLPRFATFETGCGMWWPTKMPTRMAFSHSKIQDLLRGQKVGCSSLNVQKRGVSARVVANKL